MELARTNVRGTFGQPAPYSVTLPAFADDAATSQTVIVSGFYGGSGIPQQRLTFSLPAPAPVGNFTVTAPENGSTVESRTVTFTGTGTEGSLVNVLNVDGSRAADQARVNSAGQWSTTTTYADDAPVAQTVNINQVTGGAGRGNATVNFTLPAVVPVGNFTVTAPENGSTVESRTVTFTGTGTEGSLVNVLNVDGSRAADQARVNSAGQWSTTTTYADDAPVAQTVNINQVTGGAGRGNATVNFTLPAVVPVGNFTVTAPENGSTVESRTVTFTGTGTEGSTVNVLDVDGNRAAPQAVVNGDDQWSTTVTYSDDAPVAQTVNINQVTGGAGRGNATVNFTLPAPAPAELPAPVITSPTEGQTVTGTQVTFEGTGTPGAYIGLLVVPTELVEDAAPQARAAAPAPADPADPILVDENGNWTVTLALLPENYTVVAIQAADPEGATGLSAASEPVNFSLVAPVPAPAGGGSGAAPAANPTNPTLAATGGADPSLMFGIAALTLLAGAGALVVSKRRRVLN
ncbi:LPXTG cell wall anchor domain-containing protein [Microbacterium radiodurans]|uniref:LPXTG cell wall anchor domain-containing protein n=1 Tax=Microbacterium radiodurans TaxID=661398 RepID=UPI00168A5863|nr:LPXTG cell wall anchor domain-containing protein [Microbacterium radiodurans]